MRDAAEARARDRQGVQPHDTPSTSFNVSVGDHNTGTVMVANGNINYGPVQRTLVGKGIDQGLLDRIKARKLVRVDFGNTMGDGEAQVFREEIQRVAYHGFEWPIGWVDYITTDSPGVTVVTPTPETDADDPLRLFANWLRQLGFDVRVQIDKDVYAVRVGSQRTRRA